MISNNYNDEKHYEIERKFLIEYPDINSLENNKNCTYKDIVQTYVVLENKRIRLRVINQDGKTKYIKTQKKDITNIRRIEIEKEISKDEFQYIYENSNKEKKQISKRRYCLNYKNHTFEIDIFPFWDHQAFMEIELSDELEQFEFPEDITIIKEVTDDKSYRNSALAKPI